MVRIPTESVFLPVRLPLPAFLLFLIAPFFSVGSFRLLARSALSAVCRQSCQSCQSCQSSHTHRPAHCHISQPAPTIPVWLPGSVVMDLPSAAIGLLLSLRSLPCGNTSIDWSNQHKPYKYKFFFSIPVHFRPLFCLSLFSGIPLRVILTFFRSSSPVRIFQHFFPRHPGILSVIFACAHFPAFLSASSGHSSSRHSFY